MCDKSHATLLDREAGGRAPALPPAAYAYADGVPIHLTEDERNRGVYVLGKTGSGKTVALTNAARRADGASVGPR